MRIIITDHAKKRMIERGIIFEEIKDAVYSPDYVVTYGNKIESFKNNLKIVYVSKDKFIRIITVIKR